ncbi:expressed unknown protein [Seminavis robusta]|uniref:Uncharacterized protein n=1 Tax=Seminavis robusta TaxID=568900 RepID=A0A9N8HQD0_9STRA|nr:expressed unknown protein [Seminavis robusta]|eukprot:Sro1428_g271841.1  (102) ;mRNA; r:9362-9667
MDAWILDLDEDHHLLSYFSPTPAFGWLLASTPWRQKQSQTKKEDREAQGITALLFPKAGTYLKIPQKTLQPSSIAKNSSLVPQMARKGTLWSILSTRYDLF